MNTQETALQKDKDGWIEWHGGECPVPNDAMVSLRFRDGGSRMRATAGLWRWGHIGEALDIMRYRISKPAEPPAPNTSAEDALWHGYAQAVLGALAQRWVHTSKNLAEVVEVAADGADAMLAEARKRGRV